MAVRPAYVGERIKRREDPRLVRGLATYTDDLKLHGMVFAAFVRSDYAAGRVTSVNAARALERVDAPEDTTPGDVPPPITGKDGL